MTNVLNNHPQSVVMVLSYVEQRSLGICAHIIYRGRHITISISTTSQPPRLDDADEELTTTSQQVATIMQSVHGFQHDDFVSASSRHAPWAILARIRANT
jgi:hypothetical protein